VYVVEITLDKVHPTGVPSDEELKRMDPKRTVFNTMNIHIMQGKPYSLGFPVFNGDFYDIEFSRNNPNKAVDSTATRVSPPASSLRSGQESVHGQP
jgi:hypothetical protein